MSNPAMVIHGGVRFLGAKAEVENFELEELAADPTVQTNLGSGRMWLNTTEQKIKYVSGLDVNGQAKITKVADDRDISTLTSAVASKAPIATTLAGYGITNAVTANPTIVAATFPKITYGANGLVTGGSALAATDIPSLDWSKLTSGKPTTLAGYGITDAVAMSFMTNLVVPGVAGMMPPVGASSAREVTPTLGRFRYNSTIGQHEGFTPIGWVAMNNGVLANYSGSIGQVSGTSIIAHDNTTPLSTEGSQLWSKTVTPGFVSSSFVIDFHVMFDLSNNNKNLTLALFRDGVFIAYTTVNLATAGRPQLIGIHVVDTPGVTTPVTYSLRAGVDSATTWYLGRGANATMGGSNRLSWTIQEVL